LSASGWRPGPAHGASTAVAEPADPPTTWLAAPLISIRFARLRAFGALASRV
jgi:hypothetical protein